MPKRHVIEGSVRAVGRGGDAVVQTDRGLVLVPGALPSEEIELEVTSSVGGVARGRLRRIRRASEGRVEPRCRYVARCGGCPLMIAAPALQREIKLSFLLDAYRGLPGAEDVVLRWVASEQAHGYRRRARFAWHGQTLGYRVRKSKRVIDVDACVILSPPLQAAWEQIRSTLGAALQGSGEIQLQRSGHDHVVVELVADADQTTALFDACDALAGSRGIAGVTLATRGSGAPATWGQVEIAMGDGEGAMRAPPASFGQANDAVNEELVKQVAELAAPKGLHVLELHCGVGNFTRELAARGPASLVAIEQDLRAVLACRENLARQSLRARVVATDANRPPKGHYDVLVLDPPRRGARALFERGGLRPLPKRIVYVSCDTATLGRDLALVTSRGYRIDEAVGFDMFPQTAHLESVVRLIRR